MKTEIKNILRVILSLALAAILTMSVLTSCSGNGGESTAESTAESTPAEEGVEYPDFDYAGEDLSKYITLGQYKGIDINIEPKKVITDEEVQAKIDGDLMYSGFVDKVTDRAVTKEDTVHISYKGLLNGVAFEGGTGEKDNFTVYDGGGFIDGFADGIIGAMPGVEVAVNLTFPDPYHSAELAGKAVTFMVTVTHIYEPKELTDEIAAELTKGEHKTAQAMRDYYRTRMNEENDTKYENDKVALVWEKIIGNTKNIAIPEDLIDMYYNYEIYPYEQYAKRYGVSLEVMLSSNNTSVEAIRQNAYDTILMNMVLYSIVKAEGIALGEGEFDEMLDTFVKDSGYSKEQWLAAYTTEELEEMFISTKAYDAAVLWQNFTEVKAEEKAE